MSRSADAVKRSMVSALASTGAAQHLTAAITGGAQAAGVAVRTIAEPGDIAGLSAVCRGSHETSSLAVTGRTTRTSAARRALRVTGPIHVSASEREMEDDAGTSASSPIVCALPRGFTSE